MLRAIRHRGPDEFGLKRFQFSWGEVALGTARLSVVDHHKLPMPFYSQAARVTVAYNGEIYNWRSLRAELSDGTPWETECDTEVLCRGWRRWGKDVLHKLNGMFAFILVDELTEEVFVARDRAGEKPLYYTGGTSGTFFIASEIKALPIDFEEHVFDEDLKTLEYDYADPPFYDVRSLRPGACFSIPNAALPQRWWTLPSPEDTFAFPDAVDATEAAIVESVRLRASCDVPFAVQLSGGLDSAIIQAVCKAEKLYTVSFDDFGHKDLASAKHAGDPTLVTFTHEELLDALPAIVYHLDTPATWTAACQWFMFQKMRQDGVIVTLSGEGADELFLGYTRYRYLWWLEQMRKDPVLEEYGPMREHIFGSDQEILAKMLNRNPNNVVHAQNIVRKYATAGLLPSAQSIDWNVTMQVLLRMADRMSSAFGMENRAPFLDVNVIEVAQKIPSRLKIDKTGGTKAVLRAVAQRLGVDTRIVNNHSKRGLVLPWNVWNTPTGTRGAWDRGTFAALMIQMWRDLFFYGAAQNLAERAVMPTPREEAALRARANDTRGFA